MNSGILRNVTHRNGTPRGMPSCCMAWRTAACVAVICLADWTAAQGGVFTGRIVANFENVTTSGYVKRLDGTLEYFDNNSTATWSTTPRDGLAKFYFGDVGGGAPAGNFGNQSIIRFNANQNVDVAGNTEFSLGEFSFFNTNSQLANLVFGVDLVLTFIEDAGTQWVDPMRIRVNIFTTENSAGLAQGADTLSSLELPKPFSVAEGFGAYADLRGQVVGDPYFITTDLILNQNKLDFKPTGNSPVEGFDVTGSTLVSQIATTENLQAVPEPSTLVIVLLGISVMVLIEAHRRRRAGQTVAR